MYQLQVQVQIEATHAPDIVEIGEAILAYSGIGIVEEPAIIGDMITTETTEEIDITDITEDITEDTVADITVDITVVDTEVVGMADITDNLIGSLS